MTCKVDSIEDIGSELGVRVDEPTMMLVGKNGKDDYICERTG